MVGTSVGGRGERKLKHGLKVGVAWKVVIDCKGEDRGTESIQDHGSTALIQVTTSALLVVTLAVKKLLKTGQEQCRVFEVSVLFISEQDGYV